MYAKCPTVTPGTVGPCKDGCFFPIVDYPQVVEAQKEGLRLVGMKFGHRSCTFDHLLQRVQRCHQTSPSHGNLGTYEGVYAPQLPPGCTQSRGVYAEKDNFNGFF